MDAEQTIKQQQRSAFFNSVPSLIFRLFGLAVINAFALWLIYQLIADGLMPLATMLGLITLGINVVFLYPPLFPIRWMAPGLTLMVLMALYPVIFTVYTAFTNFSDGHILSKQQAVDRLLQNRYLPEEGITYAYAAYQAEDGDFRLWITDAQGNSFMALPDEPLVPADEVDVELDEEGVPVALDGYRRLSRGEMLRVVQALSRIEFGGELDAVFVRNLNEVAPTQSRFRYDEERDVMLDQATGTEYFANEEVGSFVSAEGRALIPGYQVTIGFDNFERLFRSPALRGPLIRIFVWTFAFAFLTVVTTFSLGLLVAIVFDDPTMAGRRLIRSLLIIPYTIPSVISVLMWRGLFNPRLGVINTTLRDLIGTAPAWTSDPTWAKIAIILINLWLGYPYMMLICSGALQAIPSDIYEAAEVDGASIWQRFWNITLPLLLVSVGPILISSFTFNFNNFNVIYLFNDGGPPIANTPTPAGHTDILITYTYDLAFAGGRGADYAYAAAITIIIFIILAVLTLFNFRFTRVWEEVSENV